MERWASTDCTNGRLSGAYLLKAGATAPAECVSPNFMKDLGTDVRLGLLAVILFAVPTAGPYFRPDTWTFHCVEYHSDNRTHTGLPWLTGVLVFWSGLLAFRRIAPTKTNFRPFSTRLPNHTELLLLWIDWYIRETTSHTPAASRIYGGRPANEAEANARLPRYPGDTAVDCLIRDQNANFVPRTFLDRDLGVVTPRSRPRPQAEISAM